MVTSPTEPANAAQHLLSRGSVKAGLQRQAGSQHRQLQTDNMSSSQERLRGQARTLWPSFTCVVYEKFDTVALFFSTLVFTAFIDYSKAHVLSR